MKNLINFKIDLGFPNLFVSPNRRTRPQKTKPAYAKQSYAVFTMRNGVIIKHTFKSSDKARAFRINARAADSFDTVSDILADY